MNQKKTISYFWLYRLLPVQIVNFLELIRFEKPIGFLLLVWPCWFSLAIFNTKEIKWYILFFIGAFFMRSAGCIINDYFDRSIDRKVSRTSNRPLAKKSIRLYYVIIFLFLLLLASLIILLEFNIKARIIAVMTIPLIIIYPLMKRITYWPQLFLGIIFSWGVFIASFQIIGVISIETILLYIGCIFWTLGYDTIYAYQDREDDIKMNLKSTAILFNQMGKIIVMIFYSMFIFFVWLAQNIGDLSMSFSLILIVFLSSILFFLNKWSINSKKSSNYYFKSNNYIGLIIFLYLIFSKNGI